MHALSPVSTRRLPWLLAAAWLAGCGGDDSDRKSISSGQFLAPVSEGAGSITVLADNMTFLESIRPDSSVEDLENIRPDSFVVGRLSSHDAAGAVKEIDEYLIYEAKTRSLLSATRCTGAIADGCSKVLLHYDGRGLDDARQGRLGASVSDEVKPLKLQNGWILGFDDGNQAIVAFRKEEPRDVGGVQVTYRAFDDTSSKNFGAGNGLIVSDVIGAQELQAKVGNLFVRHMIEIEPNKILVFFVSDQEDVHLIELTEEEVLLPFDLDLNPDDPTACDPQEPLCLPVRMLRGTIKLFPDPALPEGRAFLPISQVAAATGATAANLTLFQPFCMTSCAGGAGVLPCDRILLFDDVTATFLELTISRNAGAISGGIVRQWTSAQELALSIGEANASPPLQPPYRFNAAYCDPTTNEISLFEENSNSLVLLDANRPAPEDNLRPLIGENDILFRRDPSGRPRQITAPAEPELVFSGPDLRLNRIFFDQGSKELQSVNYETGVVVLVSSPLDVNQALGATGNFVFLDPNPSQDEDIRVFDQQTNSLINMKVKYSALPIRVD